MSLSGGRCYFVRNFELCCFSWLIGSLRACRIDMAVYVGCACRAIAFITKPHIFQALHGRSLGRCWSYPKGVGNKGLVTLFQVQ